MSIPTTCPNPKCKKRFGYEVLEHAASDGGIVFKMDPCPHCGFTVDIATLTARGVQLRDEMNGLKRKPSLKASDVRRLEDLENQYSDEYRALEIAWPS